MNNASVLRFNGTLKKWNEERGFGFVVAEHGDQELFVHVTAFPRNARQPMVGEVLSFEIELDREGRKRAVRVRRPGDRPEPGPALRRTDQTRQQPDPRSSQRRKATPSSSFGSGLIALLMVAGLGWYVVGLYRERGAAAPPEAMPQSAMDAATWTAPQSAQPSYRCDGRQHCSQMGSCEEAKFFIRSCPNTKMDGDGDGVPCEQQLCTGAFGGGGLF